MERKRNEEEEELEKLTKDLEQLQLQINQVNNRINNIRSNRNKKESIVSKKKETIKIGDTVIVTGNYRNRKGVTGTVIKITPAQIRLRPSNGNNDFQVYKQNVKLA